MCFRFFIKRKQKDRQKKRVKRRVGLVPIVIIIGIVILAGIIVGIIFLVGLAKQAWFFGGKAGKAVINVADQKEQNGKETKEKIETKIKQPGNLKGTKL